MPAETARTLMAIHGQRARQHLVDEMVAAIGDDRPEQLGFLAQVQEVMEDDHARSLRRGVARR